MAKEEQFDYLFKIVIIGDSGVGKTNLLSRFVDDAFSMDSKPTIGVQFATKTLVIDSKMIKNQIWDTAGQERFRAITNAYYRGAQGAIIVYDLTKSRTFDNISKWLGELRENAEPDITVMLLGNKSDLEARDVKMEAVEDYIQANKLLYLETSALSGQNVEPAFNNLIKQIYDRVKLIPEQKTPVPLPTPTNTTQKTEEKKKPEESKVPPKQETIKLDNKSKNNKKDGEKKKCCG